MLSTLKSEYQANRLIIWGLVALMTLSYSIYITLPETLVHSLGEEDGFFEYLTALFFLFASIVFLGLAKKQRNIFFLGLGLLMFLGCGEEISWGQRIFGWGTPEGLRQHNVQGETTLHNIEILNSHDFDNTLKTGWRKWITVDFLYKFFCIAFGVLLPLAVMALGFLKSLASKLKLPVPALAVGVFFLANWMVFKIINGYLLPPGHDVQYYDTVGEISECLSAAVFFAIAFAFRKNQPSAA